MGKAEVAKAKFDAELTNLRELEKRQFELLRRSALIWLVFLEHTKYVSNRRILETQLTENKMVNDASLFLVDCNYLEWWVQELGRLEEGEVVMKLIGPTLLKQDTEEVKINVNKRIEYIESEMLVSLCCFVIHFQYSFSMLC